MNIEPLNDRVVVRPDAAERTVGNGSVILMPDAYQRKPRRGVVLAVGPGHTSAAGVFIPTTVQVGQKVLYGWTSEEFAFGPADDQQIVMREADILAVVEG